MMGSNGKTRRIAEIRCAIYTRKSTEEGLEQEFNSLDAQREAGEAFIASQKAEGWVALPQRYDDGGFTGANIERPALKRLMADVETGRIDCIVVYKVDRLSRSLLDFARLMESFEKYRISFVSVTQQFNTTHSMGRLTLNILLSFAQFEREIISERTRDKIAAARRKGKWAGGMPVLGYDLSKDSKLQVNAEEAQRVREIFKLYIEKQSLIRTAEELANRGWRAKQWTTRKGTTRGGRHFDKGSLRQLLTCVTYLGKVKYKDEVHPGEHEAIVEESLWQKANQLLRANGRSGGMYIRNKYGALLKGLLFCRPCGLAMGHSYTQRKNGVGYRYYVCQTAQKQGWHACPSKSLPAEQIEQFVVDQIKVIGADPAILSATLDASQCQDQERLADLEAKLRVLDRELRRIHTEIGQAARAAKGDGQAAARLADLHERLREIERQRTELTNEMESTRSRMITKAEVDEALQAFDPLWDTLSPREQSRLLGLLIRRIEYDGENGKVTIAFHQTGIKALGGKAPSRELERAS